MNLLHEILLGEILAEVAKFLERLTKLKERNNLMVFRSVMGRQCRPDDVYKASRINNACD